MPPVSALPLALASLLPAPQQNAPDGYAYGHGASFGRALCRVGDVDGDGLDEFAVSQEGCVWVLSGTLDRVVHRLRPTVPVVQFGLAMVRLGDADGDGVDELAVGGASRGGPGAVFVFDLRTGEPRLVLRAEREHDGFGLALSRAGDHDGDGIEDLLVGVSGGEEHCGAVQVRSGADGSVLREIARGEPGERFGETVVGPLDADGDERPDFAVATRGANEGRGGVTLHSGRTGELVRVVHRRPAAYTVSLDDGFGHVLRVVPDVDGDGRADLWVSARHDGALGAGVGQVHSVATGERLARFLEQADPPFRVDAWPFGFGCAVDVLGDLDRDGRSLLVVGGADPFDPRVFVVDPSGGEPAVVARDAERPRFLAGRYLGAAVAGTGDLDGDGAPDLAAGVWNPWNGSIQGQVWVVSGRTGERIASLTEELVRTWPRGVSADDTQPAPPRSGSLAAVLGSLSFHVRELQRAANHRMHDEVDRGCFGRRLCSVPDLDGDGRQELAIAQVSPSPDRRRIWIVAGTLDRVLRVIEHEVLEPSLRHLAVESDESGRPELLVELPGPPDEHRVLAAGLRDDAQRLESRPAGIRELPATAAAYAEGLAGWHDVRGALLGDVDGDGFADTVCGGPNAFWGGAVHVVSGRTGAPLLQLTDDAWADAPVGRHLGTDVVALGDLDGDGVPDFAASLHNVYALRAVEGEVWICSGRDGSRLATLTAAVVEAWPRGIEVTDAAEPAPGAKEQEE